MHILEAALVSNLVRRSWTVPPAAEPTEYRRFRTRLSVRFAAAIAIIGIVTATLDMAA